MVYIRLNWNLIEKQISMNSLNCCVRIEGWEKTHLRIWLSRTWSRNFKSVKQCHGWNFHSSVSTFSLHHLYSSFFYCKTLNLYRQSLTKLAKQQIKNTDSMYRVLISTWNQIDMHSGSSDRGPLCLETMPWVCGWVSLGHVTVPWVKGLGWFWLKTVKYTCVNLSGDLNWLVAIGGVVIRINKRGKVRREIFGYRNVFCTKRVRQYRCLLVIN